ncbi:GTPase [Natrarchaeobius chitinivorans]|nr:GTPase [Natrarchaeobius chitinivorans]
MAVDPEKFKALREKLDELVEVSPIREKNREFVVNNVLGPAFGEMDELIDDSRPPRLYVFGRSGAGKSSVINALANKQAAEVGAVEPTTVDSELYHISFPDRHASWDVVDSRGLFESVTPDGEIPADTVSLMKRDLEEYRPDMLVHVMTPDHVRAGKQDFETVERLREELGTLFPPVVYCLNKVDTHASPGAAWPPEENPSLAGDVKTNLEFVSQVLDEPEKTAFWENQPLRGYEFDSGENVGVVPTYAKEKPYWNVETLSWLIGDFLPIDARLQFNQAQRRERLMRKMSRSTTNRFSSIAAGVGGAPTPVADIVVLSSLQAGLVALIGSYSCRDLEWATVQDYMSAVGVSAVGGLGAREVARSLVQLAPVGGQAISGAVAAGTTWAIGRSAEEYFFNDNVVKPSGLLEKGKARFRGASSRSG